MFLTDKNVTNLSIMVFSFLTDFFGGAFLFILEVEAVFNWLINLESFLKRFHCILIVLKFRIYLICIIFMSLDHIWSTASFIPYRYLEEFIDEYLIYLQVTTMNTLYSKLIQIKLNSYQQCQAIHLLLKHYITAIWQTSLKYSEAVKCVTCRY